MTGGYRTDGGLPDSLLPGPSRGWQVQADLPGGARMLFGTYASIERSAVIRAMQVVSASGGLLANAAIDVTPIPAPEDRKVPR